VKRQKNRPEKTGRQALSTVHVEAIAKKIHRLKAIPHKDSAADAPAQSLRSRVSFGNNYHSDR
jgi:hypothetical protein